MGILSGVVSYLLGLIINLLDVAITGFLSALGFNLDIFETYFPAARDYYDVITGFAVGLLFIMFIFQVFKNFGVVLDMEVEDPLKMLGKTALFFGMIMCSRSITGIITKLLVDPYNIFLNAYSADSFEFSLLDLLWSFVGGIFMNGFTSIVYVIMLIVLGWQFLKFVVEIVERYIVFYFVLYCAPVVYATGAFKSTAQIFKSWTRMVASQGMLLLLNVWSIKLFISFMEGFRANSSDLIFTFLLGYAFLKFSQKADTLLRILGLNTASTGEVVRSIGSTIGGIAQSVRTIGGIASKAVSGGRGGQRDAGATRSTSSSGGASQDGGNGPNPMGSPGGKSGNPSGGSDSGGLVSGITSDVTGSARDNFAGSVLSSAKAQMKEGGGETNPSAEQNGSTDNGTSKNPDSDKEQDGIQMRQGNPAGTGAQGSHASIYSETREQLSQLARGLPHDQYDPAKKSFSGGGFQEFTGEDANIIGSTQMPPADGFTQYQVKMPDGSFATMYQNSDTGEAHVVQFGSVDNGVIQGTISSIDGDTGKMGDDMAFKAVHESVPGAASFSSHSVPVSDGAGGAYHVATGGAHSFFEAGAFRAASPISSDTPTGAAAPTSSYANTVGPENVQTVSSAPTAAASGFTPGTATKMTGKDTGSGAVGGKDFASGQASILRDIAREKGQTLDSGSAVSGHSAYEASAGVAGGMGSSSPINGAHRQQDSSAGTLAQDMHQHMDSVVMGSGMDSPPVNSGMKGTQQNHADSTNPAIRGPEKKHPDDREERPSDRLPDEKGRFEHHHTPE